MNIQKQEPKILWMLRGGSYMTGALAGQLHFNKQTGAAIQHVGFRLVLS